MFRKRVLREMLRTHKVIWFYLVHVQRVFPECLKYVGQSASVAQKVDRHVLFEIVTMHVCPHVLGVCVIGL